MRDMELLLKMLAAIFVFLAGVHLVSTICIWDELYQPCKIKFDQFKKFYYLNPSSYKLEFWYAIKRVTPPKDERYNERRYTQEIRFNYIDTIKYQFFRIHRLIAERQEELDKNTQRYLKLVQEDIDRLTEKSEEYKQQACEEMNKFLK